MIREKWNTENHYLFIRVSWCHVELNEYLDDKFEILSTLSIDDVVIQENSYFLANFEIKFQICSTSSIDDVVIQ